jgi:hypothetical protein
MGNNVMLKLKKKCFGVACLSVSLVWSDKRTASQLLVLKRELVRARVPSFRVSGLRGA